MTLSPQFLCFVLVEKHCFEIQNGEAPFSKETKLFSTEKACSFLERPKTSIRKRLLLLFTLSYYSSLAGKWWSQLEKHNAAFCSRGSGNKKEVQGCLLLTHSWGTFLSSVGLCSFLLVAMASERQYLASILKLNSLTNKIVSIWGYFHPHTPLEPFQKNTL